MAYSSRPISGPELIELRVSVIDDPEFYLGKEAKQSMLQHMCIFRTSYGISREMMTKAKSPGKLLSMCQLEALENHIALINRNLMHSVKSVTYGIGGVPHLTMMGYMEMVDRGIDVSKGVKVVGLRNRICNLIKLNPGPYWDGPLGFDYNRFEWVSEIGLGLEGDGRETETYNLVRLSRFCLRAGSTL